MQAQNPHAMFDRFSAPDVRAERRLAGLTLSTLIRPRSPSPVYLALMFPFSLFESVALSAEYPHLYIP
jgi:hypothetical protein